MSKEETVTVQTDAERSFKNFRTLPEIENFYRFVHDNDLRREALMALSAIVSKAAAASIAEPRAYV